MTTTTIKIKDYSITITGHFYEAFGDGFHEEHVPAKWEISDIVLNNESIDIDYLTELVQISESELDKLFSSALNNQDYLDWEMCQTFI